jgi:chloramphenicol-sensitive protein RarD
MKNNENQIHGTWVAILAYVIWGLFPVYWKWLQDISALQLVSHRIVWTCATLGCVILLSRKWKIFIASCNVPGVVRVYLIAAMLMGVNWLVFTLAVNSGHVTQTGLGYYISPLVTVLMGVLLIHERLRFWQGVSVGLAALGVIYLTMAQDSFPWMALALAFSFGTYGLVKKNAPLGALHGLMLETCILLPAALLYLAYCHFSGQGSFISSGTTSTFLMVVSGLVSMSPLLLFSFAAQRLPLSRLGILQYITPTLQLLLGILVYHEPFNHSSLIGFGVVWAALLIFGIDGLRTRSSR